MQFLALSPCECKRPPLRGPRVSVSAVVCDHLPPDQLMANTEAGARPSGGMRNVDRRLP